MDYVYDRLSGRSVPLAGDPFGRPGAVTLDYLEDLTSTPGYAYYGEALPGTPKSAAGWRIVREDLASGATGSAAAGAANQVWDGRTGLVYSL